MPEILAALEGHRLNGHHRMMITFSLDHLRFLEEQIVTIDDEIARKIESEGWKEKWEAVQSLPAVGAPSAAALLAETGVELSAFPSVKHFSSWAGVCPGNNVSAGKSKGTQPTHGNRWLQAMLTECAWAATTKKNCFLKEKYWRIQSKTHQKGTAVRAVSHTLLQLLYKVLTTGERYEERGQVPLDERRRERLVRHHVRRLGKLGICCSVSPIPGEKQSTVSQTSEKTAKDAGKGKCCSKKKPRASTNSSKHIPSEG